MTISRSSHVAENGIVSFFFTAKYCIYVPHLLYHPSVDGHAGCLHVLAVVNSATMNIEVCLLCRCFWNLCVLNQ